MDCVCINVGTARDEQKKQIVISRRHFVVNGKVQSSNLLIWPLKFSNVFSSKVNWMLPKHYQIIISPIIYFETKKLKILNLENLLVFYLFGTFPGITLE